MSKCLVSASAGEVRSTHAFPMDFSIAGHYVIDLPDSLRIKARSKSVTDLLADKVAAFQGLHPLLGIQFHDELVSSPNVDTAKSTRYVKAPGKGAAIFPGGRIVTGLLTVGSTVTAAFAHWYGFTLFTEPASGSGMPGPDRLLFNYNPVAVAFEDFNPATFTVQIRNSADNATLATLTPDVEQSFSFGPGDVRLRFINTDPDRTFYLSDWILLLG